MPRLHILISGRVQGVFFRASTRDHATSLGLSGWVRNLVDGRVEAVAEGDRPALEALLAWCEEGPPQAQVREVRADWSESTGEFDDFEVRR